ncbi:Protein of unknown function [Gryllus bimaculatus]|nr:Protein of unknown function [Gryllus bimaculatus]
MNGLRCICWVWGITSSFPVLNTEMKPRETTAINVKVQSQDTSKEALRNGTMLFREAKGTMNDIGRPFINISQLEEVSDFSTIDSVLAAFTRVVVAGFFGGILLGIEVVVVFIIPEGFIAGPFPFVITLLSIFRDALVTLDLEAVVVVVLRTVEVVVRVDICLLAVSFISFSFEALATDLTVDTEVKGFGLLGPLSGDFVFATVEVTEETVFETVRVAGAVAGLNVVLVVVIVLDVNCSGRLDALTSPFVIGFFSEGDEVGLFFASPTAGTDFDAARPTGFGLVAAVVAGRVEVLDRGLEVVLGTEGFDNGEVGDLGLAAVVDNREETADFVAVFGFSGPGFLSFTEPIVGFLVGTSFSFFESLLSNAEIAVVAVAAAAATAAVATNTPSVETAGVSGTAFSETPLSARLVSFTDSGAIFSASPTFSDAECKLAEVIHLLVHLKEIPIAVMMLPPGLQALENLFEEGLLSLVCCRCSSSSSPNGLALLAGGRGACVASAPSTASGPESSSSSSSSSTSLWSPDALPLRAMSMKSKRLPLVWPLLKGGAWKGSSSSRPAPAADTAAAAAAFCVAISTSKGLVAAGSASVAGAVRGGGGGAALPRSMSKASICGAEGC